MKLPKFPTLASLVTAALPTQTVDPDDDLYRRVTMSRRDLTAVQQDRMIELAWYIYDRNPIARRIIDIQTEYVLGEGMSVSSDDENVDKMLKRHWNHPVNDWEAKATDRFRDLRLFGEAIWTVAETPGTGTVVLGTIDPYLVQDVIVDGDQLDEPVEIRLKQDLSGKQRRYKVIRYDAQSGGFDASLGEAPIRYDGATQMPDAAVPAVYDGLCFYFAINKVAIARRGRSDLFGLIDYIDAVDQFVWGTQERARIANAMVFDVSVMGGDQGAVEEEAKRIRVGNVTRPGGVNVHSDAITWQILSPNLGASEAESMMTLLMRTVLGGAGLPEYMFANPGNTNRATANEQSDPVIRRMTMVQKQWIAFMNKVLRYQYERARAKDSTLPALDLESPLPWKLRTPDISAKDLAKLGTVVAQVVTAFAEGEAHEYISKETARAGFLNLAKLLGVDADPEEEAAAIAAQPKPAVTDYITNPPTALQKLVDGANKVQQQQASPADRKPATEAIPEQPESESLATLRAIASVLTAAKPEAPVVNSGDTHVTVQPAAPAAVTVENTVQPAAPAAVTIENNVQPAAPAAVTVEGTSVTVQPAAPAAVDVHVAAPAAPDVQVTINEAKTIDRTVEYDGAGNPTRSHEERR